MDKHFEYRDIQELDYESNGYIQIPASIILDKGINEKRTTVFSFFAMRRGLDYKMFFSVNNLVKWMGRCIDTHKNGVNDKVVDIIRNMIDKNYLKVDDDLKCGACIEATFNLQKVFKECDDEPFAIIYTDELKKILGYKNLKERDIYFNSEIILLVFAYLRMKISRRPNRMMPEEINIDNQCNHQYDISRRRLRSPDAYDCYYIDIAEELGISNRLVSNAITVLNDLELIYSEILPRNKYDYNTNEKKWKTNHTIFCNTYKREGNYVLASGKDYYLTEVENKKKRINYLYSKNNNN